MAEIAGRREKNSEENSQARKWNYETINRYPLSPGATLARIRLLPCGDHGGFSLSSAERFFDDAADYDGSGEVLLKNYQDLRALAHVRTLITLGSHDQTALSAIQELQTVKTVFVRRTLSSIANDFFQKMIMRLLEEGKSYEALSYYTSVAPIIPPAETVTDIDYLLKLSQAASQLGLGRFAKKLSDHYDTQMNRNKQLASFANRDLAHSKELVVDLDEFESQLRTSERGFTEAKALWISSRLQSGDSSEKSSEVHDTIRNLLKSVKDESSYSFEKEVILGLIEQSEGKEDLALKHVIRAQVLNRSIRVQNWLARLQRKFGDQQTALDLYRDIEKRLVLNLKAPHGEVQTEDLVEVDRGDNPLGLPSLPTLQEIMRAEAEIQEKIGNWQGVAEVYQRGFSLGLDQPAFQYSYARALNKMGDPESLLQASVVLNDLSRLASKPPEVNATAAVLPPDSNEKFWKRMASETLADARSTGTFTELPKDAKEGVK